MSYVFDTYALLEWFVNKSRNYAPYFKQLNTEIGYVSRLSLLEFYHRVFHKRNKEDADYLYIVTKELFVLTELTDDIIKEAGEFRSLKLKEHLKLSYTDCVNYVTAKKLSAKLLTGDAEFKNLKNVEFVR